jgi:signal transduction histidine kinase/CheY-like chemotaxis protein
MLSMHFHSVHRPDDQRLRRLDLYVRQASDFITRCRTEEVLRKREEALRESDRLKNEFLAVLGHELRNPLAPIYNTSELLSRTLAEHSPAQASLALIKRQTEQLMRMVDDLLDVARITQGHISLRRQPVELSSVVAQGIETTERLLRDKQHELSTVSSFRPVYVSGDAARLAQCVSNLVSNAAKYTDHGGRIRVEIRAEESTATIEVSDNGIGIPETLMPRIFELFVQGDQSLDRTQGGLGIGLPVVRRLVEMHGGRVSAHSAGVGKGSRFEIRLPRIEAPAAVGKQIEPANVPSRRIFIVDDNADAADTLAALLEMDGHEVQAVKSSKEAIERIESFKPDIALLDIGLPEIDGYDLLRRLRAIPALQEVRFIAITGYGRPEDRQRIRQAGFESHLVKPVTMSTLAGALIGNTKLSEGGKDLD